MAQQISLHFDFDESHDMLLMESDFELLAMDVQEYRENILFASFEDDMKQERNNYHDSNSTALTEDTSLQETDGDDDEFINPERIPSAIPSSQSPCSEAGEGNSVETGNVDTTTSAKGTPGKLDVLCGQSRTCASHFGNRRFQNVLDLYAPKYDAVNSKQEKMALTKEIVSCIQASGGRFLRFKNGEWQEISTVTARDKVSHALRTKVASWKRQNQQQQQEKSDSHNNAVSGSFTKAGGNKSTPRGRRSNRHHSRQRSSSSSINTRSSDIPASSFDGNDPTSNNLIEDLLKTQREIFASLQKHTTTVSPSATTPSPNDHPLKRTSR